MLSDIDRNMLNRSWNYLEHLFLHNYPNQMMPQFNALVAAFHTEVHERNATRSMFARRGMTFEEEVKFLAIVSLWHRIHSDAPAPDPKDYFNLPRHEFIVYAIAKGEEFAEIRSAWMRGMGDVTMNVVGLNYGDLIRA